MSGHTPGPWSVEGAHVVGAVGLIVRQAAAYNAAQDDLHLIAAAPELLEALCILATYPIEEFGVQGKPEKVLFGANDWCLRVSDVLAARAAIAKATGADA